MATTLEMGSLEEKARDFCEFVVGHEVYQEAWKDIEAFLEDEEAKQAYQAWQEKGAALHHREHHGVEPTEGEVEELQRLKDAVMAHPIAASFLHAEGQMNRIFSTFTKMLQKTLQSGRVPSAEELESGCCGGHGNHGGCGCH